MPSTFFTEAPHWRWLIIWYFFLGGLAGGCYFLASLMDLFGRPADRRLARVGYLMAFPGVLLCGALLTVDLHRPERFWHMLIQSATWRPMFKAYSPMSLGAWALLAFGFFSLLSFLAAYGGTERRFTVFRPPGGFGIVVSVLGGISGAILAGYTGVLLAVTNRPIWADTNLLGLVFLISAASTSAALLILFGPGGGASRGGLAALARFDSWVLVFELIALIALVVSLGPVARVWLSSWGALLVVGVIGIGIVLPFWMHRAARANHGAPATLAAVLVLIGGFVLRAVIVLSAEGV